MAVTKAKKAVGDTKTPAALASKVKKVVKEEEKPAVVTKAKSVAVKEDNKVVKATKTKPAAEPVKASTLGKRNTLVSDSSKTENSALPSGKKVKVVKDEPKKEAVESKAPAAASKKRTTSSVEASRQEASNLSTHPTKARFTLAFEALLHHLEERQKVKKQKISLPGVSKEADTVFLQIGLHNMPEQALKTFKGRPIQLPHPFRDLNECSVCMFVKDKAEAKKWLGDDYQKHGIQKILSLEQLRTQYNAFSSKRELAEMYDAFVADDRIVCMLPKALGKAFYVGAKRPLPIRLAQKEKLKGDVSSKVKKALGSAFFYLSGVSTSIRIGSTSMPAEQLVENAETVLKGAVEHIPGKWKGVQSVFVKSEKSPALPVYERLEEAVEE